MDAKTPEQMKNEAFLLKARLDNERAARERVEGTTGADLLDARPEVWNRAPILCKHGVDVTKWSFTVSPCQHCMVEWMTKTMVCYAVGHDTGNEAVGYLMKTDPYGDGEARQADDVYCCSRCGALTTS